MTTFLEAPGDRRNAHAAAPAARRAGLLWQQVEPGFWVANADGNFGGTVERVGRRYCARDAMGTVLDVFADAASARDRVAERYAQVLPTADGWE
ncbi:hypothetical protein GCM10022286_12190 [Gryllotalpicola daejeonensis]|uniref:Uncharacterized protein n=1 Tax=Gryllotalpicola daejeonensis TaxID=993087 RepID=A0ABP7ZI49_9MICO